MLIERNPQSLRRPSTPARRRAAWLLYAVCALTLVPSLFIHPHAKFGFAELPAFHALLAFVTGCVLVLAAIILRRLIIRGEDYYEHRT
ncbi:hypothetical protein SAOR_04140 [Salinisphaera orenii MK-B5]|uniref:Uncharacterized protein n=2 Tax=Salinisphaera orenii TaxID=856731 RepID=A0A423PUK0_9GAMM|nr:MULTISPECIES: hypothetical protein [Salinisphaera]ROO29244.1 hypothetical protein SAOR_04140 [Salinisphaera orenii MK-B5]ROO31014.1 hypothetical protein SAHL_07110 [Salinisphaera halophila YIM 95161]